MKANQAVHDAIATSITNLPEHLRRSLTWDQGTDLARHSTRELTAVAAALNSRPRKALGWKSPAEAFNEHLYSLQSNSVATAP